MQLKRNDENNNIQDSLENSPAMGYYDDMGGSGSDPSIGQPGGPYGSSMGQPGFPQGVQAGPAQAGQPGNGMGGAGMYDTGAPRKKGINPLVIIIPVLIIAIIIFVSQFRRVFGKSKYIAPTVTETTYSSEYFGVKADIGTGWDTSFVQMDTESEIRQLNAGNIVNEFRAQRNTTLEAFSIDVEQMPYNVKETGTDTAKMLESFKEEYERTLTSRGYSIDKIQQDKLQIAGKTCDGYVITCTFNGMTISMLQYFIFKGNYAMMITTSSTSEGKARLMYTNYFSEY